MSAYYNEFDPKAAAWLRELIKAGLIAPGDVDERSIVDVKAADLVGYTQCHFFAGIGGWSYGLRLAGWPDERPVWTGSCPCQPFSAAGKHRGAADERHLWPVWMRLVRECKPPTLFGEQVASAIGQGWLDAVFADLEGEGYACGASVLPACSVGAPHKRDRLWFVAHHAGAGRSARVCDSERTATQPLVGSAACGRGEGGAADSEAAERGRAGDAGDRGRRASAGGGQVASGGSSECVADADGGEPRDGRVQRGGRHLQREEDEAARHDGWCDLVWLPCRDGKARPTQRGLLPLAHGVSGRVGLLRGYGNAIVPALASEFIRACREAIE